DAHVDLVYSLTTPGTTIIKDVMPPTTPVVFSIVTYPVQQGFIKSYESSGTNLVGTSNYVELDNYVKLRKALLPQLKTLAIFHRKGEPNSKIQADEMRRLSEKEGIQVLDLQPESIGDVRKMALELVGKVDAFMTTTDTLMQGGGEQALIEVSLDKKIPILSSNKAGIEQGSTFGPVADFYVLGKMSGEMAVKILRENAKPSDLKSRIQEPPLILVNRKSAAILGIAIPDKAISNLQYVE
ncbi:MAG: ABC transporter substrate-binding protein, partial [Deltaproteobacteria bacterium]|nr:ABC transporter substrate-binding protein [Deltaproteobacteria bacterium]